MTADQFRQQMARMTEVYSDKSYPSERLRAIFSEMKSCSVDEFEWVVTELIANNAYAPMISKFREARVFVMQKNGAERDKLEARFRESQPWCQSCGKTGSVMAVSKDDGALFGFRCFCQIGERSYPRLPMWTDRLQDTYTRDPYRQQPPAMVSTKPIPQSGLKSMPKESA